MNLVICGKKCKFQKDGYCNLPNLCLLYTSNLYFYNTLMEKIRVALEEGTFEAFRAQYVDLLDTRI